MAIVTRFAPSPTGLLHLGHAWSALLAWRRARDGAGRFVLRIEDIDTTRCRPAFVDGILEDLRWLGMEWDALVMQSALASAHAAALARLVALGVTYRCVCSRADIAAAGGAPHAGEAGVYPGTCRGKGWGEGAVRLDVAAALRLVGALWWEDMAAGRVRAVPDAGGDVVLARKDIGVGYLLACVVDDAAAGVSEVVRGRDLFAATHAQRLLQALLELPVPRYHHHPLLLAGDGRRLAKRDGAATLRALREGGVDGGRLAARLLAEVPFGADRALTL
ncbi:tRNA glutamyl-Q(34) synthetase GluQRS [Sandaracinobacteroides saxicola]|uniref:tRNA glutamyl-Q(34) synthetase GluQRS n=1 Tax=Sandaracinobacteroides saxicola TaxID=2759707 RepID=A0A7G5IH23_9SPHN|nr:tRNA glutamyl-Q(34) synthetase GluQRS [Sandaracinobacteroides saxicola]QMW22665.1 tRNA glutamyl-Q(34) synthetase GluQRS [Sandaracinobacteroides saxicola]